MDYKKFGQTVYVRLDKGDEIISSVVQICKRENILSATYSGIGACDFVDVRTYIPERDEFLSHTQTGVLELISLTGNISCDDNKNIFEHSHALFSYLDKNEQPAVIAGHLMKAIISYTGEITLNPVENGIIGRMKDPHTGIEVWKL